MKTNIDQIKKAIDKKQDIIKDSFHVGKVGVFGSVARAENTKDSDIDMLVELTEPISMFKFIELEDYLSSLLNKKVDLVTKNALKPAIKEEILQETIYV